MALGTVASAVLPAVAVPAGVRTTDAIARCKTGIVLPLPAVAPVARDAVIAVEDACLYQHGAIDV